MDGAEGAPIPNKNPTASMQCKISHEVMKMLFKKFPSQNC